MKKRKKNKKHKVWIIVGTQGSYVGWHFTKKEMIQTHIDHLGYIKWKEAYAKGDRAVKATLIYKS